MGGGQNDRPQQIHGRGYPSYSSGSSPASNASAVSPSIIMLTVQYRPFILIMNPSYSGLTFEKLVIVNAIRRDTVGQIDNTLYDAFGLRQVAVIYGTQNQYRVVMEV